MNRGVQTILNTEAQKFANRSLCLASASTMLSLVSAPLLINFKYTKKRSCDIFWPHSMGLDHLQKDFDFPRVASKWSIGRLSIVN